MILILKYVRKRRIKNSSKQHTKKQTNLILKHLLPKLVVLVWMVQSIELFFHLCFVVIYEHIRLQYNPKLYSSAIQVQIGVSNLLHDEERAR